MRIAYVVLTCETYFYTRVPSQKETSLLHVNPEDIFYLGHTMDLDRRLYNWGASDDYHALPNKFVDFFKNLELDYDFYVLIDDDTYVFHNRLIKTLEQLPSNAFVSMGHILDHVEKELFRYMSGGAGTVLSRSLYKKLCSYVKQCPNPIIHWCADICLGKWIIDIKKEMKEKHIEVHEMHNPNFHPEQYDPKKDHIDRAITFHHLKTREQYFDLALLNSEV